MIGSARSGYCSSWIYLAAGSYPSLLSTSSSLYSPDRVEECMNRCLADHRTNAIHRRRRIAGDKAFYIREDDQRCACAKDSCTSRTGSSSNKYTSYRIKQVPNARRLAELDIPNANDADAVPDADVLPDEGPSENNGFLAQYLPATNDVSFGASLFETPSFRRLQGTQVTATVKYNSPYGDDYMCPSYFPIF